MNNNKSNTESFLSNRIESIKKRNNDSQQRYSKIKSPSNVLPNALKLTQSANVGTSLPKNCDTHIVSDSLDDNLIKQDFAKVKPITLINSMY